jgi:hypothetical protein
MQTIVNIILAGILIIFFIVHLFYYKKSEVHEHIITYKFNWKARGLFFSTKMFFPVSIKFSDSEKIRRNKTLSNKFLYACYILCILSIIIQIIFSS